MKKKLVCGYPFRKNHSKWLMTMRLCLFFMLGLMFQVSAEVTAQNALVSVNMKDASLVELLIEFQKKTDLVYFYSVEDVEGITLSEVCFENTPVKDVLSYALIDTELYYEMKHNTVVLKKNKKLKIFKEQKKDEFLLKGIVTDNTGEPLPGVSVFIMNKFKGVATDINGKFEIKVKKGYKLLFTFVGMKGQTIVVKNQKTLKIVLKENKETLNDVVITGYQVIDKRELSSSVVTVNAEKLKEGGTVNVANMLQGKISGLSVLNETSTVGAAPKIRIRGISSISGNREPLWVVDGVILEAPVPLSSEELNSLDNVNLIGNAISSINPEDIDRIDVLKDASATAIYGVRAANGVIVITTKRGEIGDPKVKYSTSVTLSERPEYSQLNRMDSKERVEVSKEIQERGLAFRNNPASVAYEGLLYDYNAKRITYSEFLLKTKQLEEQNTDWFDELYRTSLSQKHGITFSGADKKVNYYFSGKYTDNNGTFKDNSLKQYNALAKVGMNLTKKLYVNVQLSASNSDKEYQHSSINPYAYAYNTSRAIASHNPDGSLSFYNQSQGAGIPLVFNIHNELEHSGKTIGRQYMSFNTSANYKLTKDIKIDGLFSYSKSTTKQEEWFDDKSYAASKLRMKPYGVEFPTYDENAPFYKTQCELPYGGLLTNNNTDNTSWTARGTVSYNKDFYDIHNVNIVVGSEMRSNHYEGLSTREYGYLPERGQNFSNIDLIKYPAHRQLIQSYPNSVTNNKTNIVSFFGIFTYAYDKRYIANFNVRADGSNRFGQDDSNKFLPVWSVSGRWNVSQEHFLEDFSWLNDLSIRASYGVQGNISSDQTPSLIVNLGSMDPNSGYYKSTLNKLPNPYLRWEKTKSYNSAMDFSILNGRISGSVDLYYKKGEDMIISKSVSPTTGSSNMDINAGNLENKGFDLTLNLVPIRTKDFSLNISMNGGKNINKVTKSGVTTDYNYSDYIDGSAVLPGYAINSFFSYKFGGLDENGLPTFKDIEEFKLGDQIFSEDGTPVLDEDGKPTYEKIALTKQEMYDKMFTYSGNRMADIVGGFSLSARYKGWSISGLFSYSLGAKMRLNDLYSNSGQYLPRPQQNMDDIFVNRWRKPGDENFTNIPVLTNNPMPVKDILGSNRDVEIAKNYWAMYNQSDLRVVSTDYLKLRNLTLKHYVSGDICKKMHVSAIDFRFEITNLFTIKDSALRGQDPQQMSFGGTGATPPTSTYTFGLNVTF